MHTIESCLLHTSLTPQLPCARQHAGPAELQGSFGQRLCGGPRGGEGGGGGGEVTGKT